MEFCVLGPTEVIDNGSPVRLAGARHERILAMLLLNAPRLVTVADLVDAVWATDPPATATSQVQNCVAALRRNLVSVGMPAGWLVRKSAGYLLTIPGEWYDAWCFSALLAKGRAAAGSGDLDGAVRSLRHAEALWRGPALAGLTADSLALQAEAARLEELRVQAVEERVALELTLGLHHQCLAELVGLAQRHPLREPLHRVLMLALQRCGRTVEALEVYERIRQRLADEFGVQPGTELREAHRLVLDDRAATMHLLSSPMAA